jgi:hypothetical protein
MYSERWHTSYVLISEREFLKVVQKVAYSTQAGHSKTDILNRLGSESYLKRPLGFFVRKCNKVESIWLQLEVNHSPSIL